MTGHQINSLVGDLVAMAQAMERLPQVEQELSFALACIADKDILIESVNRDLEQSRGYAASLEAKVHNAEVARDDAELRFLESDDGKLAAIRAFRAIIDEAEGCINVIDPPKPQPEPQPEPNNTNPMAYGEPIAGNGNGDPQGQSEPDPTPSASGTQFDTSMNATTATLPVDVSAEPSPPSGPYSGRRYIDYPGYVSRMEWLAGGGTEEDYDFRY